jgi:uncharacterized protein YjbI with pentapeptide repeats
MSLRQLAVTGVISLALTQSAFADGVAQSVDALETDVDILAAQVSTLQTENAALQSVITSLTAVVDTLATQQAALIEQQRCHGDAGTDNRYIDGWIGGVDWHGCDKKGIALWGPQVGGDEDDGNLTNADLRFTDFTGASMIGVWMGGVDVEGANFTDANLAYSEGLQYANVIPADGNGGLDAPTIFSNTTCPDETNSDANGGTCIGHLAP